MQSWIFENESLVQVGRGSQNHVVLYSAVVSRRHAELSHEEEAWYLYNRGTNGTYVNGHPLETRCLVQDGMIMRLGESGPKLRIHLSMVEPQSLGKVVKRRRDPSAHATPLPRTVDVPMRDPKRDKSTFLE